MPQNQMVLATKSQLIAARACKFDVGSVGRAKVVAAKAMAAFNLVDFILGAGSSSSNVKSAY